ncbi:MAG: VCBS repeat-containing protein [Gemmatimonadetes bacterium]|nr:VCBS repeat-containing protein [Gemmatimonadota bacterium]
MRKRPAKRWRRPHLLVGYAFLLVGCDAGALEWREADGYRWAELSPKGGDGDGFTRLDGSETGITFENVVTEEQYVENSHYLNGSGVALGDVDGDGRIDVYFASMDGPNALYRNLGGWRFEEIAAVAGVDAPGRFSTGATFADVDGDGDLDLLVTALGGPNALYRNDGSGSFTDVTAESGLESRLGSMSMALADVDGDGDLDLYVGNNKVATVQDLFPPDVLQPSNLYRWVDGEPEVVPEFREHYSVTAVGDGRVARAELAEPDRFYLNDGTGRFTPVSFTDGAFLDADGAPLVEAPRDWALSVRFHDMDRDGDPDLYVCNDFHSPDHIWINDGTGRFRALDDVAMRSTSFASMAIDFSDIDRDGDWDFFLAEMLSRRHQRRMKQMSGGLPDPAFAGRIATRPQKPRNTLYVSRGDGTYAEAALYAGVAASEWSWGTAYVDVDLDGYEDLLIGTGHFYDAIDKDAARRTESVDWRRRLTVFPSLRLPNVAFRNRGDLTFEDASREWRLEGEEDISHGLATGDLDGDGDLDVVMNRLLAPAAVLRNDATAPRVAVRLRGEGPNTTGVGALVRLLGGAVPEQSKEIAAGGGYLSGSDSQAAFAAGDGPMTLVVAWRSGRVSRIEGVEANRAYEIHESAATAASDAPPERVTPMFEDVSARLGHAHQEDAFDDFDRQPLVPVRFSQSGPGLAWFDSDRDGDEDLFIGAARGGVAARFENDGAGGFLAASGPAAAGRDQTGLLGSFDAGGRSILAVGASSLEVTTRDPSMGTVYAVGRGSPRAIQGLPPGDASAGPLASADTDGDGDLDLFVGGRLVPGRYPAAATSRLLLNDAGTFSSDARNEGLLEEIGLVSGAVFSDTDSDGDPDLVLAMDWGPIRVLLNQDGVFRDATAELGLEPYTGWWNGVATGDFDADGRPDIVATNRGLNTRFEASPEYPATIRHADFDNNGTWDAIETRYDPDARFDVPIRGLLTIGGALPALQRRIRGFEHYGGLSAGEVIGEPLRGAAVARATTLSHALFLNRGDSFEAAPLPAEAQLAAAFAVVVADFDADGAEDVFLGQNLFALRSEVDRDDAGRGLLLRGDGRGSLFPVSGSESGIAIYGETRSAAASDFDSDGRVDLVASQNGAATKLYRNTSSRPGLRVRLVGPRANPDAIGSAIRLRGAGGLGPLREIQAGSGYWSQNGAVSVLGSPNGGATAVWIRWPDGSETETEVPGGSLEVTIDAAGGLLAARP